MYTMQYIHTSIHAYIHTYIPTYLPAYLPTYIHVYIYTYVKHKAGLLATCGVALPVRDRQATNLSASTCATKAVRQLDLSWAQNSLGFLGVMWESPKIKDPDLDPKQ